MLGKTFSVICIFSVVSAFITGNITNLSTAILTGAARAVELTLSLLGMMCLWCGVMNVLKSAGAIEKLSKLISPLLKFLFPTAYKTGNGIDECALNLSANLLGIGNAATPFAISALEKMQLDNKDKTTASDDMITLAVMNASPISLLPTTLIALRASMKSTNPTRVLLPIWICSTSGWILSVVLSKAFAKISKRWEKRR